MEEYAVNREVLDFDFDSNSFINTMKELEKKYWHYIDNICHRDHPINFCRFVEKSIMSDSDSDGNKKDIPFIKDYCKKYDKYKKSLATAGAAIIFKDFLLLVKMRGCKVFSMPKGKSDNGETLKDTAIREVREETGLDLKYIINTEDLDKIYVQKTRFYVVQSDSLIKDFFGYDKNEIYDIKWFHRNTILNNPSKFSKQVVSVINKLISMHLI